MDVSVSFPADDPLNRAELQDALQNALDKAMADGKLAERDILLEGTSTSISVPEKGNYMYTCIIYFDAYRFNLIFCTRNGVGLSTKCSDIGNSATEQYITYINCR